MNQRKNKIKPFNICFKPLAKSHFPLLLKWLEAPHVKKWWDQDIIYTMDLVIEKYGSYTKGYKQLDSEQKPVYAFIIYSHDKPIGYIQYYNAYDFSRDGYQLENLPKSLAALDIFIGEETYLGKGIGQEALGLFLEEHLYKKFDYAFVDPDVKNQAALRCYEKARFNIIGDIQERSIKLMLRSKKIISMIEHLEYTLLQPSTRKSKEKLDRLLADDFKEFGQSGEIHIKQDILSILLTEHNRKFTVQYFETIALAPNVFLVTYQTIEKSKTVLRSSIWKNIAGDWKMIFHQGTKARIANAH